MANKLRSTSARVSFFAFLDTITTVTGVLLLITLMMTISLKEPQVTSAARALDAIQAQVAQAQAELEAKVAELRQRQWQAAALTNRVFVVPEADRSGREPILIALSATNGLCSLLGQTNVVEFLARSDGADFGRLLDRWNPHQHRLVFYIRPSGIVNFQVCEPMATNRGFSVGYDAAQEGLQYLLAAP